MLHLALALPLVLPTAPAPTETATPPPHEAVLAQINALRENDVEALLRSLVTDLQYAEMEAAWEAERQRTPDPKEDAQFQDFVQRFAAQGAEQLLWPDIEAKLDEMRPQVGMLIGMFTTMAQAGIQQNKEISDDERKQATAIVQSLSQNLMQRDLTDAETARRALAVTCDTVRKLDVHDLADVYALDFHQLLDHVDLVFAGAKSVLKLYGFDVNAWLANVSAETMHVDGEDAVVLVTYEFLGQKKATEVPMRLVDGRWFQKDRIEQSAAPQH